MDMRSALIVGVGSGLSASLARLFAKNGLQVALASRNPDRLAALAHETAATTFACEAAEPEEVGGLFDAVIATQGVPDVVVYNASARARGPIAELDPEAVARAIAVSAYAGFLVGQQAARHMLPRGTGAILFTGASATREGLSAVGGVRDGQVRAAWPGAEHGARAVAAGHPRRALRHRRRRSAIRAAPSRRTSRTACSIPTRSPRATGTSCSSRAVPGPGRWNCGRGSSGSEPRLDRRIIALVWICGIVLMAAVYAIGPQHFLAACEAFIAAAARFLDELAATLMWRAFEVTRAAAIALYAVFVVLAVLGDAARPARGRHAGGRHPGVPAAGPHRLVRSGHQMARGRVADRDCCRRDDEAVALRSAATRSGGAMGRGVWTQSWEQYALEPVSE